VVTHLLHAPDREHMREATNDRALMGMSGLSKMGWWGRENLVVASKMGGSWGRKGSATRVVGKARGETVSTGAKEAANKNKTAHLLHMQDEGTCGKRQAMGRRRGIRFVKNGSSGAEKTRWP
jgi:hypothetical protein